MIMPFLTYDEPALVERLLLLSERARTAFAASCLCRLAAALDANHSNSGLVSEVQAQLLAFVLAARENIDSSLGEELVSAIADVGEDSTFAAAHAEDTLAAAAYAIRCAGSGQAQDAAWAARRAYETVDRYAGKDEQGGSYTTEFEAAVMRHPIVQREINRQRRDLDELANFDDKIFHLESLIERASQEPIID